MAVDFDDTLAPILGDPAAARPLPRVMAVLTAPAGRGLRVVVPTGRPAEHVVRTAMLRSGPDEPPTTVLGHHGLQRGDSATDRLSSPPPHPALEQGRARRPRLLAQSGVPARIEDKTHGLSLHTRCCENPPAALGLMEPPVRAPAGDLGLRAEVGRLVLELRPDGIDKGTVLAAVLAERPTRSVLYAGDDLADPPVVRLLSDRCARGGTGVLVHSAPMSENEVVPELASSCALRVSGPDGVAALLAAAERALVGRRP
ncbi:trehalose-phosphatase [Streptomyces canus]|uniref:trehalose-phosphatase n=1 Tax=Streptomyces canus TaxID=58343 RepID=UPI0027892C93|nr:trehalose-phosphatase [Streptomyces canus]MDQ1068700.1 trehalose 6-phosphate phosphatase [Streptomyces canus]